MTNLLAVDPIVLVLPSVNGFHVERVAENKVKTFIQTEISEPILGKHAFDTDHETVAERLNGP